VQAENVPVKPAGEEDKALLESGLRDFFELAAFLQGHDGESL
jgi:hypothetical protein